MLGLLQSAIRKNVSADTRLSTATRAQFTAVDISHFDTSGATASNRVDNTITMANAARSRPRRRLSEEGAGVWTDKEHSRFLEAMELYPKGPWKLVSDYVGTRNPRQTMTHAQKYRQKLERHQRGLRTKRKDAAEFANAHGIVPKDVDSVPASTTPLPVEYGSPKDVSNEVWMGPMEALLHQSIGFAQTTRDPWWSATTAKDNQMLLPLSDLETHSTHFVDVQPVQFDDCLDYFIESLS